MPQAAGTGLDLDKYRGMEGYVCYQEDFILYGVLYWEPVQVGGGRFNVLSWLNNKYYFLK